MFTIEKGKPIPETVRGARNKYPLQLLQPGDSFFIPVTDSKKQKNLRSSMGVRAKSLDIAIVTLADETGIRVWRTK